MQNNMNEETLVKIKELKDQIRELNAQLNEKQKEIDKLVASNNCDFEGSYVEFYDAVGEYVFMWVKKQTLSEGEGMVLYGPSIRLSDSPLLSDEHDDDGIDFGSYNEDDKITVSFASLSGSSVETIRKITKKDMKFVVDYYFDDTRKNMI